MRSVGFWRVFSSSYAQSLILRIVHAALSLLISLLLSGLLGPAEYGRYGILLSFATILAIPFTSGLPGLLTRDIASARAKKDFGRIKPIIRMGTSAYFCLLPVLALIVLGLWLGNYELAGLSTGVIISGVLAPIMAADSNRMGIMRGLGLAIRSQIPDLLVRQLGFILLIILLLSTSVKASAVVAMAMFGGATLIGFIVGFFMAQVSLKQIPESKTSSPVDKKDFTRAMVTLSLLGGANVLTGNIDMLLLGSFASHADAGHYKVALAGVAIVLLGGNAISAVTTTRLAEVVPIKNYKSIAFYTDKTVKWSIFFTLVATGIIYIAGEYIIRVAYGVEFLGAWPILMVLAVGHLVGFLFGPGREVASLSGSQVLASASVVIGIGVTIGVSVFLAPNLGAIGIAIGSALGTISRGILVAVVVYFKLGVDITFFGFLRRLIGRLSGPTPGS